MFDKIKFAQILKNINETYESQRDFSKKSEINRTYLSQYMNMKLDAPPKPKILKKLADASNGIATYENLMVICGYIQYGEYTSNVQELASYFSDKNYQDMKSTISKLFSLKFSNKELNNISCAFALCCQFILDEINSNSLTEKSLSNFKSSLSSKEKKGFNYLYISLLRRLHGYVNVPIKKDELFSIKKHLISKNNIEDINLCKDIINGIKNYYSKSINDYIVKQEMPIYYMCPVYSKISAGQPNWAEKCIEGRIPIAPDLMNILDPEEYFFLRMDGESMNQIIKNGAFALIHKQDIVENGEIAVVLVNGYDATLKKLTKQDELIILEPQSIDSTFKTQVYHKNTSIKILGKYVGKIEINK